MTTTHVIALSGGKDSVALALRLRELYPERQFVYFCSPTGDELPEMEAHWAKLEELLGQSIVRVSNGTLASWIDEWDALPNWRQRWCTRKLKIEPCIAYLVKHAPAILYVGLRADEETREGIYGDFATYRHPLKEWGWGIDDVRGYLKERGVKIPRRTDCARCYGQRLREWKELWEQHPEVYANAEAQEVAMGHTFRSPQRDTWPADLASLRAEFEKGKMVRGETRQLPMFEDDEDDGYTGCRVCRL